MASTVTGCNMSKASRLKSQRESKYYLRNGAGYQRCIRLNAEELLGIVRLVDADNRKALTFSTARDGRE